jgi:hypothetical protein
MKTTFIIINTMILSLIFGFWRLGLLDGFPQLAYSELIMVGLLCIYSIPGFVAAFRGNFDHARFVANSIPIWALGFTVLGMLLAVSQITSFTPDVIGMVFKNLAYAITPNMIGVILMAWIRELSYYCGGEEI